MRRMQTLAPWQGSPEWSVQIFSHLVVQGAVRRMDDRQEHLDLLSQSASKLTDADGHDNTNYELHLRAARPLVRSR